jgi:hypothetical protein
MKQQVASQILKQTGSFAVVKLDHQATLNIILQSMKLLAIKVTVQK